MWILTGSVGAIDNNTGDEIYVNLGADGLVRVYHNTKIIAVFHSVSGASDFIEKHVAELNSTNETI